MHTSPTAIHGKHVVLSPLSKKHIPGLKSAVEDGRIYDLWFMTAPRPEAMEEAVEAKLAQAKAGRTLPFTILRSSDQRVVGATNYLVADLEAPRIEISGTWLSASAQRAKMNTEATRLLLAHAFEKAGCAAVEFKTLFLNYQGRTAIEHLGAKLDGVLRNHQRTDNGALCDICVYSIIETEWPSVKAHLDFLLLQKSRAC